MQIVKSTNYKMLETRHVVCLVVITLISYTLLGDFCVTFYVWLEIVNNIKPCQNYKVQEALQTGFDKE